MRISGKRSPEEVSQREEAKRSRNLLLELLTMDANLELVEEEPWGE